MLVSPINREEFCNGRGRAMLENPEPMETDSDEPEVFENHFSSSDSSDDTQNGAIMNLFPFQEISTPELKQECPLFEMSANDTNKGHINQIDLLKVKPSQENVAQIFDDDDDDDDDEDDLGFDLFDSDPPSKSHEVCTTQTESNCLTKSKVETKEDNNSILDEILKDMDIQMSANAIAGPGQEDEFCCICRDEHTNPVVLPKCSHKYCRDCIDQYFKIKPVCPECFVPYGVITGNQPDGTMDHSVNKRTRLQGQDKPGAIVIYYSFSDGTQNENHPKPGVPYYGTSRTAYLPDTPEGHKVLKLLQTAFERRLVFTVGRSRTTGADDVVTWNDIHHKTSTAGGQENFGYPDPTYLQRVQEELAAVGVTEESIAANK